MYGEYVTRWIADQLGAVFDTSASTAIGDERAGRLIAGVAYTEWNTRSVVCHWVIGGRPSREWFWYIHHYAFDELGVFKVIAPVYSDNQQMMKLAPRMGFIEEGRLVNTQPSGDIALFTLTADRCRILGDKRYGKVRTSATLA